MSDEYILNTDYIHYFIFFIQCQINQIWENSPANIFDLVYIFLNR